MIVIKSVYPLEEYFCVYLKNILKLSESSIKHYLDALNNISRRLKEKGLIKNHLFEVIDAEQLDELREILFSDKDFIALNMRGNHMYSAGFNNYYKFAKGTDFYKIEPEIKVMDVPIRVQNNKIIEIKQWNRSTILRRQVLEIANYKCEIDSTHKSFIAESNNKMYMEGHHAIPIKLQDKFENSLDVYANIICLCPICHKKIHYGLKEDKQIMMNSIYEQRIERLRKCGIFVSKEEFAQIIL